jgi:hypothetical protein
MHRILMVGTVLAFLLFFGPQPYASAQEVLVPAGTLLHCTVDEPNFSSATADIGDPLICHLNGIQEFGRVAFPRGSYLQGHLEADREPGHFFGKGYLKLEFDRIGLPHTDVPVPSKVVALRGYRVDREGDIVGKGHAKRDAVEWLLPPFWPWKVLTLPLRGPRPALKGESQLTLRLMDDIVIPKLAMLEPGWHYFGESSTLQPNQSATPAYLKNTPDVNHPTPKRSNGQLPATTSPTPVQSIDAVVPEADASAHVTFIALKSDQTYAVARYRIDREQLNYALPSGVTGSVSVTDIDWIRTSELNSHARSRIEGPVLAQAR